HRVEAAVLLASHQPDCADFNDPVFDRHEARGLDVDDHERRRFGVEHRGIISGEARSAPVLFVAGSIPYNFPTVEKSTVEPSLDASIQDGASYNVIVGLGELYVGACAVFLGAKDTWVALLTTIPLFLGSCAQIVTPVLIDKTGK